MLKSVIAAASIGILGGITVALFHGSIAVFENYVDGVWITQFEVSSLTAPIIGAIIGTLAGANIGFALPRERVDAFSRGALIGAAVGVLLILTQAPLVALATVFGRYNADYQFLLTRFSAMLTAAAILGAITGMLLGSRPLVGWKPGALLGLLTALAFVPTGTVLLVLKISSAYPNMPFAQFVAVVEGDLTSQSVVLLVGAGCGAIVGAVANKLSANRDGDTLTLIAILLAAVIGVSASSLSLLYILNFAFAYPIFSPTAFHIRLAVGLSSGAAVGIALIALKAAATRPKP